MKSLALIVFVLCTSMQFARSQEITFKNDSDTVTVVGPREFQTEMPLDIKFTKAFPKKFSMEVILLNKDKEQGRWTADFTSKKWKENIKGKTQIDSLQLPDKNSNTFKLMVRDSTVTTITIQLNNDGKPVKLALGADKKVNVTGFFSSQLKGSIPETIEDKNVAKGECLITDPSLHYFTPIVPKGVLSNVTNCVNCLNDYKVVYDLSSEAAKICYFKREKCDCDKKDSTNQPDENTTKCKCPDSQKYCYVPKKRIRPRVDSNVGFHIFGYYPYYDSIGSSFNFESKNLEQRDEFSNAISSNTLSSKPKTDTTKGKDDAKAAKGHDAIEQIKRDSEFFGQMRKEFVDYFSYILTSSPDMYLVKEDADYISNNLMQYCLTIEEFSSKGLIVAAEKYLAKYDNQSPEIKRKKLEVLLLANQAAMYYGFILNYHSMKVPVVQIKNEDQFQWTVDFYKNRKKIDTRLYAMMISGGWKIDFSSGFVFNNLKDNKYSIQYDVVDITDDNIVNPEDAAKIVKQDEGKYLVDIGVMTHIYPRTGTRVNLGLTTGIVIRNGDNIKYALGGSLMLGYEQRFIISGGIIGGGVQKLDGTYSSALDTYVEKATLTAISSSVPTIKTWDWGSYFSISYNLGGVSVSNKTK